MARTGSRYGQALRNRDLRLILTATLIDQSGSWAYNIVLAAYVFGRSGSPGWVAAIMSTRWIVGLLASGPAGVIADRYDRRRVVQSGALCAAAAAAVLTVLVAADAPLWALVVNSALIGALASVNDPAAGALVPDVVGERDLAAANALMATLQNVVVLLGPAVGGLLLVLGPASVGVAVNAVSFVLSALIYTRVRTASRGDASAGQSMVRQFATGWQVLIAHRVAFILVIYLVLDSAVFGATSVIFGPLSVHLGTGADGYSYLIATQALGGVLAAAGADRLAARARLAPVIMGGFVLECVPIAFYTATGAPLVASALSVLFGMGMVIIDVVGLTALQRDLPREVLGRANAIMMGMVAGATAAMSLVATLLLSAIGLTATVVAVGVAFPLAALLGLGPVLRTDRANVAHVALLEPRIALISSLDLFTGAGRPVLERLAEAAQEETAAAGTVLIRQGDPADALWLLADGRLAVEVDRDGVRASRPDVVAPGYVGELGLLRAIPRTATVTAATECALLRIPAVDFLAALQTTTASRSLLSVAGERFTRGDPQPIGI